MNKITGSIKKWLKSDGIITSSIKNFCDDKTEASFGELLWTQQAAQSAAFGIIGCAIFTPVVLKVTNSYGYAGLTVLGVTSTSIIINYLVGRWEDSHIFPAKKKEKKESVTIEKPKTSDVKVVEKKELSVYEKGLGLTKALSEYNYSKGGGRISVAVVGYNDEAPMVTVYKIIPVLDKYNFDKEGNYIGVNIEEHLKKGGKIGKLLKKGANLNVLQDLGDNLSRDLGLPKGQKIAVDVNIGDGKGAIYLPKEKRDWVYLDDYLETIKDSKALLPMFLGKTLEGGSLIVDMVDGRHSAIVGMNKSGKTIGMIAQLLGLAYSRSPENVEIVLIDPKFVGFNVLKNLPHVKCGVITDLEEALHTLENIESEMKERYIKLQEFDVQDIVEYNTVSGDTMPFKVIAIDEFLDLLEDDTPIENEDGKNTTIAKRSRKVLGNLFKKGRGAGIHVNVLSQRFAAEDIPGNIRNNSGLRVCMSVTDSHASRMVLDEAGGETLLGFGDTLTKLQDWSAPIRSQGAGFKNDSEDMKRLVKMIGDKWQKESLEEGVEEPFVIGSFQYGGGS